MVLTCLEKNFWLLRDHMCLKELDAECDQYCSSTSSVRCVEHINPTMHLVATETEACYFCCRDPPPGFGMAPASNGNAPPGFPSHSGSDGSVTSMYDQQAHHWPPSQDAQQHWSHFQQSYSSPCAAGTQGNALSLHHSHSAGPSRFQAEPFGNARAEQPAEHETAAWH